MTSRSSMLATILTALPAVKLQRRIQITDSDHGVSITHYLFLCKSFSELFKGKVFRTCR